MSPATVPTKGAGLGFESQTEELTERALAVSGELPAWLGGTLVRVTPALLEPGGVPVRHWFDGLAMLHSFSIGEQGVSYANRFLESRAYREVRETGRSTVLGFATDPCRSLFQRVAAIFNPSVTDNCNVNVTRMGERWVAMTETPLAIEFDAGTLATQGHVDWADKPGTGTAHPHYDFRRRETISYGVHMGPRNSYRLYAIADGSTTRREIARIPVRRPAYMHSFALTDRYAVLFDTPFTVNPLRLAAGNRPFIENYQWDPERGSRFLVIDRETGKLRASVEAEAFFTFHVVNAFERDGELVVDLSGYDDPSIIDALYLDRLRAGDAPQELPTVRRFHLPLGGGRTTGEQLSDTPLELPRIAYRTHGGKPYRCVYGNSGTIGVSSFLDSIVKVDVESGASASWQSDGCYPGEPVFVARPGGEAEDDGVLLSVVLDSASGRSFLLVLDAADLSELARAEAPHHIPLGFHGDFARS